MDVSASCLLSSLDYSLILFSFSFLSIILSLFCIFFYDLLLHYLLHSLPLHTRYLESVRASDGAITGVLAGAVSAWWEFSLWGVKKARRLSLVPVLVVDRYPSIHPIFISFV